jgi:hypothetical protein
MKKYKIYNDVLGWLCFVVAAFTYLMTVEPTASFWDCPEFISQGVKLEVGHPPGNPIFMLAARFFVNFAGGDVTKAALMVNSMSALLSAGTILLLFWTITHLVKRLIVKDDATDVSLTQMLVIFGSGLCGALAYTWSDTFWFSAVEGEVYAFSSFCTALVFWLILKWENRADQPHSDRYLILIAYIIGVSIAVHLLNLLCIPAIVLVIYYRKFKDTTATGSLIALAISAVIIALILFGLVPGFVEVAQYFELFFVNVLGCSYNVGVLVYTLLFVAVMIWALKSLYAQKSTNAIRWSFLIGVLLSGIPFIGSSLWIPVILLAALAGWLWGAKKLPVRYLTIAALSILVIFAGYSSYALLLIRSHANPPMNQNSPDNVFALSSYLSREQYGETPLLYGQTFTSTPIRVLDDNGNVDYLRRPGKTVYRKAVKSDPNEPDRYVAKQEDVKYDMTPKMLFPRMYSTSSSHPQAYLEWINASVDDLPTVSAPIIVDKDGNTLQEYEIRRPSFAQNLQYFFNYQLNHMYWRYFMWNFAGRQNDYAGDGQANRGNWISGIPFIDNSRLGDQSLLPDEYGAGNKGHNVFYMLPLLLGIFGLTWQAFRSKRGIEQFWVIFFFFFMTGIAIVLYLNQPPLQPRERDYAFAGSFYAFAIWVGMGVAAVWTFINWLMKNTEAVREKNDAKSQKTAMLTACATLAIGILVPLQMVSQTWDDHDRSGRYTTRDFGMNYLSSVAQNGIIFTNGDNDTFPLWYAQEVEGYRTDVRVVNLSYLTTDWYANQMRVATDGAAGLKFSAKPADYAFDRLQFSYFDPENMVQDTVNVFTSLDDLYHSPEASYMGARLMRMPYMSIPSNLAAAVKQGVISQKELPAAEDDIVVALYNDPKNPVGGATLSQVLSIDMIATQAKEGWTRPAYFAMTVPDDYYVSLSPYMRNTGLAYQVSPILNPEGSSETWIDTDKMYANVTEKFRWGGLDKLGKNGDVYLDETVRRMVTTHRSSMAELAMSLYNEGIEAQDSTGGKKPDMAYANDRFTKSAKILDMIEEKLPVRVCPYSIQIGSQIAETYLRLADITGNKEYAKKGLKITHNEIVRYAKYLPYFSSLRKTLPYSGFSGLSPVDRYVPTYLYSLLQLYSEYDGDLTKLSEELAAKGIDINDLEAYLPRN